MTFFLKKFCFFLDLEFTIDEAQAMMLNTTLYIIYVFDGDLTCHSLTEGVL